MLWHAVFISCSLVIAQVHLGTISAVGAKVRGATRYDCPVLHLSGRTCATASLPRYAPPPHVLPGVSLLECRCLPAHNIPRWRTSRGKAACSAQCIVARGRENALPAQAQSRIPGEAAGRHRTRSCARPNVPPRPASGSAALSVRLSGRQQRDAAGLSVLHWKELAQQASFL